MTDIAVQGAEAESIEETGLARLRSCRALIFDFDGVIVESENIKTRAFMMLYRPHGTVVVEAAVAHHQANGGISRRKKIRFCHKTLLGIDLDEEALDALAGRFSALIEDEVVGCPWVPGAQAVLEAELGRRPMFVVSGTPQDELDRIIERRGLGRFFVEVHGSPPEKPPVIRDILARHRLAPDDVLFVGDSLADWRAAHETSVHFIGRHGNGRPSPFPPGTPLIPDLTPLTP